MIRTRYSALFCILLLSFSALAQSDKEIDQFVLAEMQRKHIPGVTLAVVKEGKVIKSKGYGLANVELNVPATTDTVYKIGSISKPIIAAGIMMLVEEGRIGLDDKVSKYLDGTPETWKDISIRNFLSHTGGVVRESPTFDGSRMQTDADVIKGAYPVPLRFVPGEKYEYCNVGYFSLAEIIRKVSGKPWSEFLAERIFKPLGMNATRTTTFFEIVPNRATGYSFREEKLFNSEVYTALRPSGAFLSTAGDLAKFETALYNGTLLKKESLAAMWTAFKLNDGKDSVYGLGWFVGAKNGHKRINHGGSLNGFRSEFSRFTDDKLTVIVLTNRGENNPVEIADGVAATYVPALKTVPAAPVP
jgi:CubicO group peptidase (beta-lactamase class C family)